MATREELASGLSAKGFLKDERIRKARLSVDLERFLPERYRDMAHEDRPLPFHEGPFAVRTITAPHLRLESQLRSAGKKGQDGTGGVNVEFATLPQISESHEPPSRRARGLVLSNPVLVN